MASCYTGYFILEYKNSLDISDRNQKLQAIEQSSDLASLKRTAKMHVNFLYDVHNADLSLWRIGVIYGALNITLLSYMLFCLKPRKRDANSSA